MGYRTGKNLFNLPLEQGSIAGSTGQNVSASNRVRTNGYFYLKGGKAYTVSATGVGQGVVYYYDKNKTFLADQGNLSFADLPRKFTVYRDGYFRIIFRKSSNNESIIPSDISNVQVEISDGTALCDARDLNGHILLGVEELFQAIPGKDICRCLHGQEDMAGAVILADDRSGQLLSHLNAVFDGKGGIVAEIGRAHV